MKQAPSIHLETHGIEIFRKSQCQMKFDVVETMIQTIFFKRKNEGKTGGIFLYQKIVCSDSYLF